MPAVTRLPAVPAQEKLRQEDTGFNIGLGYVVRLSQNKNIKTIYITHATHTIQSPHAQTTDIKHNSLYIYTTDIVYICNIT